MFLTFLLLHFNYIFNSFYFLVRNLSFFKLKQIKQGFLEKVYPCA